MINDSKQCPLHALNGKLCETHSCPLVKRWMPRVIPHGNSKLEMKLFDEFQNRMLRMMFDDLNDYESKKKVQDSTTSLFLRKRALNGDDLSLDECYKDCRDMLFQLLAQQQKYQREKLQLGGSGADITHGNYQQQPPRAIVRRHSVAPGHSLASLLHQESQRRRRNSSSATTNRSPHHEHPSNNDREHVGNMAISTKRRHSLPASHNNGNNHHQHHQHPHHHHQHPHHSRHHQHNHAHAHASFSPLHQEDEDESMQDSVDMTQRRKSVVSGTSSSSSSPPPFFDITEEMVIPEASVDNGETFNTKEASSFPFTKFLQRGQPSSIRDFVIHAEDDTIREMNEYLTEHSTNAIKVRDPIGTVMRRCLDMIRWMVMRGATIIPYGIISLFSCEGRSIEGKFIKRFFCEVDQGKELLTLKQVILPQTSAAETTLSSDLRDHDDDNDDGSNNNDNSTTNEDIKLMCQLIREYASNIQQFKKKEKERMMQHKRSRSHSFSELTDNQKRPKHKHHQQHQQHQHSHQSNHDSNSQEQKQQQAELKQLHFNNCVQGEELSPILEINETSTPIDSSITPTKPMEATEAITEAAATPTTTTTDQTSIVNNNVLSNPTKQPTPDLPEISGTSSSEDTKLSPSDTNANMTTQSPVHDPPQSQNTPPPPAPLSSSDNTTSTTTEVNITQHKPVKSATNSRSYGKMINFDTKTGHHLSIRQGHPIWIWDWDQSVKIVSGTILGKGNELQAIVAIHHNSWNMNEDQQELVSKWQKRIGYNTNRSTFRINFDNIQWTEDGGSISDEEEADA